MTIRKDLIRDLGVDEVWRLLQRTSMHTGSTSVKVEVKLDQKHQRDTRLFEELFKFAAETLPQLSNITTLCCAGAINLKYVPHLVDVISKGHVFPHLERLLLEHHVIFDDVNSFFRFLHRLPPTITTLQIWDVALYVQDATSKQELYPNYLDHYLELPPTTPVILPSVNTLPPNLPALRSLEIIGENFLWYGEVAAWLASHGPWRIERLHWEWPFPWYVQEHNRLFASLASTLKTLILAVGSYTRSTKSACLVN